jgi:hypothetical protein
MSSGKLPVAQLLDSLDAIEAQSLIDVLHALLILGSNTINRAAKEDVELFECAILGFFASKQCQPYWPCLFESTQGLGWKGTD